MKTKKQLLALVICVMTLLCFAQAAFAAEEAESVSVTVSFYVPGEGFVLPKTRVDVPVGLCEEYGFTNAETVGSGGISTLDVLIRAHEVKYDSFSPGNADTLMVSGGDYGTFISRLFGIDTYACGFAVNGECPHDDVLGEYGYTGYSVDQAEVKEGDYVQFFVYGDTSWYSDCIAYFTRGGEKVESLEAKAGEECEIVLSGYEYMYYGCSEESVISAAKKPLEEAVICLVDTKSGEMTPIDLTDGDGRVTLKFDEAGKYVVSAADDEEDEFLYIIAPWLEVNVKNEEELPFADNGTNAAGSTAKASFKTGDDTYEGAVLTVVFSFVKDGVPFSAVATQSIVKDGEINVSTAREDGAELDAVSVLAGVTTREALTAENLGTPVGRWESR